jgi:hypothetical protein
MITVLILFFRRVLMILDAIYLIIKIFLAYCFLVAAGTSTLFFSIVCIEFTFSRYQRVASYISLLKKRTSAWYMEKSFPPQAVDMVLIIHPPEERLIIAPGFHNEAGIETFDLLLKPGNIWLTIYVVIQDLESEDTVSNYQVYELLENDPCSLALIVDREWNFRHSEFLESCFLTEHGIELIERYAKEGMLPFVKDKENRIEKSD